MICIQHLKLTYFYIWYQFQGYTFSDSVEKIRGRQTDKHNRQQSDPIKVYIFFLLMYGTLQMH